MFQLDTWSFLFLSSHWDSVASVQIWLWLYGSVWLARCHVLLFRFIKQQPLFFLRCRNSLSFVWYFVCRRCRCSSLHLLATFIIPFSFGSMYFIHAYFRPQLSLALHWRLYVCVFLFTSIVCNEWKRQPVDHFGRKRWNRYDLIRCVWLLSHKSVFRVQLTHLSNIFSLISYIFILLHTNRIKTVGNNFSIISIGLSASFLWIFFFEMKCKRKLLTHYNCDCCSTGVQ